MKHNYLYNLIILFLVSCSSVKTLKNSDIKTGKIIYYKYDILTEEAAKNQNKGLKDGLRFLYKDIKDSLELEKNINSPGHDVMLLKAKQDTLKMYLQITSDYYIQPRILNNGKETSYVKYTDRDSLYQCVKKGNALKKKCKNKTKLKYFDESKYKIEYLKNDKKKILGYNCFKIIATRNDEFKHTYEMYVTDKINLGFNYIINFKTFNSKYLILELKKTTSLKGAYNGFITKAILLE